MSVEATPEKQAQSARSPWRLVGALAAHVSFYEDHGCTRCDRWLGIQRMPEGYALMLNGDETHFFWLRHDGAESSIDWNKWRVRRAAIAHANQQTKSPNAPVRHEPKNDRSQP